jgi:hypothetical protein
MFFNGKYDDNGWIEYKKELKDFLKDCFDHHDSYDALDPERIEGVKSALNIIIGFSNQYSNDQEEWTNLHKYLNSLYVGIPENIEMAKADFYQLYEKQTPENSG